MTDEVPLDAAAASVWTVRVVAFTRWVGAGRNLTQTGQRHALLQNTRGSDRPDAT